MAEGLTDAQVVERLTRMEEQIRRISAHLGLDYDDGTAGVSAEVVALARSGDRMGAAKMHAEQTGVDFVTAQRVVSAL
ncbi:MAG TPA: hypothetical protein VD790_07955 [Thermoleophilaceae bacterium]|nr:hypothetical protein [Thermoleophilaceae bacterium]